MELLQMLDLAPQYVAVFGAGRERLYANRILLDYLGVTLEEWRQRLDRDEFVHPDDWERANDHFNRALSSGAGFELELRLRKADGSYRWFLVRHNPVRDDKGEVMRWYAAGTDIEDRKRAEEKLQQENAALREEVDQTSMFEEICWNFLSIADRAVAYLQSGAKRFYGPRLRGDGDRQRTYCPRRSQTIQEVWTCFHQCELCRTCANADFL
jgi:PAS domain S-box-containing protein